MKKLTLIISLLFFILCAPLLFGQSSPFSKVIYDELNTSIQAYDIAKTEDNGFILVGESIGQNALVIKIDSIRNPLWNKVFFTSPNSMNFFEITNTYDSCFVIGGSIFNEDSEVWDIFLVKINNDGGYSWIKNFTMDDDYANYLTSITETSDSGFIMTGYTYEFDQNPKNQILVIKTNSVGDLEWSKKYYAENNVNKAYSIKELDNGEFIVVGEFNSSSNSTKKAFMMNITEQGEVNWAHKYVINNQNNISTIIYDILASSDGLTALIDFNGSTILMRTHINGNSVWGKDYHYESNYYGQIPRIHQTSDNALIFVSGFTSGYYTKTDLEGNILQTAHLMLNPEDIIEVKDKGLLIIGNGPIMGVKDNQSIHDNIGLIQLDSLGHGISCIESTNNNFYNIYINHYPIEITSETIGSERYQVFMMTWQFPAVREGCVDVIGGIYNEKDINTLNIYPNPNNGSFTLGSKEKLVGNLSIHNPIGQRILQKQINDYVIEINIHDAEGIYFYQIETENKIVSSGKFIIQK